MDNEKWLKNMIHNICVNKEIPLDQKIKKLIVFKILSKRLDN